MSGGFTIALLLIGTVREVLGKGSLFGLPILGSHFEPWVVMVLPPGGFLVMGVLLLLFARFAEAREKAAAALRAEQEEAS
jgi:electron transport complex protein RnfE